MKVTEHTPPSPPAPPSTFTIEGLTRDELTLIKHVVGTSNRDTCNAAKVPHNTAFGMYCTLRDAVAGASKV